jgi:hypothetical protein
MTGIGRKEVRRLRYLRELYEEDPRIELSPLSDVLHHWFTNPVFLDESGKPKVLSFRGADSFVTLVKECAGDLPAGAIKVELVRCGAVREDEGGELHAMRRHVVPTEFDERLITSIAFGLRGLASTVAFNSNPHGDGQSRIQRFVESEYLTEDSKNALRHVLRDRITSFTEAIDDMFSKAETPPTGPYKRIGVGVYYYEDEDFDP